jgi:hypothetical protein
MESLQDLVKERKIKMHQKERKDYNNNYEQLIKNTFDNKSLKI